MFICLSEPERISVFWGYLCIGDSWAESYKLTWVTITSGLNQIPLLQIEDMLTATTNSDIIIYRLGPAILNVKTFLHHVKLIGCYVHSTCCVKWFLSALQTISEVTLKTVNLTPKGTNLSFIPSRDFFVCWCWSGFAFSTPPSTETSQKEGDEKAKALADHWSMTQLLKSLTSNQIVQLQGAEVPQSCPGPLNVTDQL